MQTYYFGLQKRQTPKDHREQTQFDGKLLMRGTIMQTKVKGFCLKTTIPFSFDWNWCLVSSLCAAGEYSQYLCANWKHAYILGSTGISWTRMSRIIPYWYFVRTCSWCTCRFRSGSKWFERTHYLAGVCVQRSVGSDLVIGFMFTVHNNITTENTGRAAPASKSSS